MLAIAGCTSAGKPPIAPRLDAVSPPMAFVEEETEVRLSGAAFTPKATTRWGGGTGDVSASAAFEVFADDVPLKQVTWLDSTTLTAVLPMGLSVGKHAVRVVDPYGVSTSLADAIEVRVRKGAVLTATLTADSTVVHVLKEVVAHLDVTNVGDATAEALGAVQLPATGTGDLTALGVSLGKKTLAPGESTRFELTWVSTKIGTAVLWGEARAVDARSGASVRVGPLSTGVVQIIPPPDVTSALVAARKIVSRGQVIELMLQASNVGLVGIKDLLPTATATPTGLVDLKTAPLKRDVAAGAQQPFSFFFDTLAKGDVSFRVDALGLDGLTGATVAMTPAFETVTIVNPAKLTVALNPSAARVAPGQRFTLTATVTNPGEARALAVTPSIALTGTGGLTLVSAPNPAIVGATPVAFVWEYDATTKGAVQLTVTTSGADENSGLPVASLPITVSLLIEQPAALTGSFTTPLRVNVGQSFGWSFEVTNTGASTALGVTPGTITVLAASPGTPDGGPSPSPQDIPAGASGSFGYARTAGDAGTLRLQASASGTDAVDGQPVIAPVATSAIILVERPARLLGALWVPTSVAASAPFTATMQVTNSGEAVALAVTPSTLAITGNATLVSGPTPASAQLSADGGVTFTWLLTAGASGTVQVAASANGTDGNDATAIGTGPLTSNLAVVAGEVVALANDPFADGTAFSFVFSYAGKVWLGPRKTGFGAVSMNPDGTGLASYSFSFARDVGGGASHANTSAAPYPSIGAQGCVANTSACGPNNENGRGLFFTQSIFGIEYLGVAGAHPATGKLEYVYFSTDTGPTINFRFLDMSAGVGGSTRGLSAAHAFKNRLYLGLPDTGGNRPYLFSVGALVPPTGLNATFSTGFGSDITDLQGDRLPGLGQNGGNNAPTVLVDAITDFNDRLYLANNGGIIRSTTNTPLGPGVNPTDWLLTTPTAAAFTSKTSITTTKVADLLPSDKAFPSFALFQGRLYVARNTLTGPQLWVCTPGVDTFCAPNEWSLIAANTTGDLLLSQFNDPTRTSIGLLAATPTTLFVGFNSPTGIEVFKTTVANPSSQADFRGTNGCLASVSTCQGLGTSGFGFPAINKQIFDARAITFGPASWLYLVTGSGTSAVRVWRIGG